MGAAGGGRGPNAKAQDVGHLLGDPGSRSARREVEPATVAPAASEATPLPERTAPAASKAAPPPEKTASAASEAALRSDAMSAAASSRRPAPRREATKAVDLCSSSSDSVGDNKKDPRAREKTPQPWTPAPDNLPNLHMPMAGRMRRLLATPPWFPWTVRHFWRILPRLFRLKLVVFTATWRSFGIWQGLGGCSICQFPPGCISCQPSCGCSGCQPPPPPEALLVFPAPRGFISHRSRLVGTQTVLDFEPVVASPSPTRSLQVSKQFPN